MTSPNPFAPNPNAPANSAPENEQSGSSPFGADSSGSSEGGGFELPPCPVGVLRGHTVELRATSKGFALDVHCDDPAYPSKENVSIWIGSDIRMLAQIAGSLGISADFRDGKVFFTDDQGNADAAAFKNKPGLFIFAPWQGQPSINKFGLPKPNNSDEWDQYMDEANFSEEQIAALKKARGGVVPGDLVDLFE